MLKDYKFFAGNMIVESDNTKGLKIELLNFIKEASEVQVKNFILYGTIKENFKQSEQETIENQFQESYIEEGAFKSIMGILLSPGGWVLWRAISSAMNDAKKKCGVFSIGRVRDKCLYSAYIIQQQKKLALLQKEKSNCNKAKTPQLCIMAAQNMITKCNKKIVNYQTKLNKLQLKESYVEEGAFKSIMGIILSPGGWVLWRAISSAMNDAKKKCGVFSIGRVRDKCLYSAYIIQQQKKLALLQKEKSNCNKAKTPQLCIMAAQNMITKCNKKIVNYQTKLNKLQLKEKKS